MSQSTKRFRMQCHRHGANQPLSINSFHQCDRFIRQFRYNFSDVFKFICGVSEQSWRGKRLIPAMESRVMRSFESRTAVTQDRPNMLSLLASAFAEGFSKAQRYQTLASRSEHELAALSVTHQDLPRFVMFGRS